MKRPLRMARWAQARETVTVILREAHKNPHTKEFLGGEAAGCGKAGRYQLEFGGGRDQDRGCGGGLGKQPPSLAPRVLIRAGKLVGVRDISEEPNP
jgi:hypothetical protein